MRTLCSLSLWFVVSCSGSGEAPAPPKVEAPAPTEADRAAADRVAEAAAFVDRSEAELLVLWRAADAAHWAHETDLTDEKEAAASAADERTMAYLSEVIPKAAAYKDLELPPDVARRLGLLRRATTLPAPANADQRKELAEIATRMTATYGKGKACAADGTCRDLQQLSAVLAEDRDPAHQLDAWEAWHQVSVPMKSDYVKFASLANTGAKEIGYGDLGELWRAKYDMTPAQLDAEVGRLYGQLQPLYEQLHCFVRAELSEKYGPDVVPVDGPIPAHLLGNMWAQDWANLYPMLEPYPGQPSLDVTKALVDQAWGPEKMVKTAEGFFVSMGLDPLPDTFWKRSMFTKPPDREVVCHASAWDVEWNDDLRIKMCIEQTMDDLTTIHHELGHDYYYHYYAGLPPLYKDGANDGFHEAIGDAIVLSMTPDYLAKIGLLSEVSTDDKAVVNKQLQTALGNIAFLPFGLMVDRWRWEVFSGKIPPDQYNAGWWRLRRELQGVAPPTPRGEEFFDAGAKYHVPANTPYLRYFLAQVLQFQFHRSLCEAAGHTGPLHTCSVYGNKAAGDKLKAMLAMGSSQPWPEALQAISGTRQMDATALVEYFDPLMTYLKEENKGRKCGW